ncbi:MAG: hypothetical protein HY518_03685 [Candidatus Aenigmarchaeota archaeon]|nr:hypothetical protein [Candidatus Aenigmarchaeota archaeon]
MVFGPGLLDFVIAVFLVLVFAEYIKIRSKSKGFSLIAAAGVLFLLAYTFMSSTLTFWGQVSMAVYGQWLFEVIGWVLMLVGALWVAADLSKMGGGK